MNEELYPELIDYIYDYCSKFKTPDEVLACFTISVPEKFLHGEGLALHKRIGRYSDDPKIQAMIADGFENFKTRVATRIYNEHKNELSLNLCPKCSKIARTPQAKQCRFCSYNWH